MSSNCHVSCKQAIPEFGKQTSNISIE